MKKQKKIKKKRKPKPCDRCGEDATCWYRGKRLCSRCWNARKYIWFSIK